MKLSTLSLPILVAAALLPATASAALRAEQINVSGTALQTELTAKDGGILAEGDQQDIQRWKRTVSGNATFTFLIEIGGNAGRNAVGVYNAVGEGGTPGDRYEIFPTEAQQGWFATASFRTDNTLKVTLFNDIGNVQSTLITGNGVDYDDFSFYIENGQIVRFGQDFLNPGATVQERAHLLVYNGTGANQGCFFLCFENGLPADPALLVVDETRDFDDVIMFVESVNPTPVARTTWASLKSRFR